MPLAITLDQQSQLPLHHQVYDQLRNMILAGRLGPGKRLPSTRLLAESLGLARATVAESYERLLSEGYIHTVPCSGTFVSDRLPEHLLSTAPFEGGPRSKPVLDGLDRLSVYGKTVLSSSVLRIARPLQEINFGYGPPAMEQLPIEEWRRLLNKYCKTADNAVFGYSAEFAGLGRLREAIASYLCRSRAVRCHAGQVIVVAGSQQALDLVARILIDKDDAAAIENPGYPAVRHACTAQGARMVTVPVDDEGLMVDKLPSAASEPLKLIYVTPSHQYPTGTVLPLARRLELLSWASQNGVIIIEDDYNSEYRYAGRPLPSLQGIDQADCVFYTGTFSKVLFPSIRLGYLVVPEKYVEVITAAKVLSDRQCPSLEQNALADFINEGHLERHVRKMRLIYERRRTTLLNALTTQFGDLVSVVGQNAGMHVLVRFRMSMSEEEVIQRAAKHGVGIISSSFCYLHGYPAGEFILGYADMPEAVIQEGIARLRKALCD